MSAVAHSQHTWRKYERKSELNVLDRNRFENRSLISNYDLINFMVAVSKFCLASIFQQYSRFGQQFFKFSKWNYDMSDIWKKGRKAQEVVGQRSEVGAAEAAVPDQEARRSDIVGADVLQVVQLQLQLTYSHVLGGQLLLQPPQLILLPEEHPQELHRDKNTLIRNGRQ